MSYKMHYLLVQWHVSMYCELNILYNLNLMYLYLHIYII